MKQRKSYFRLAPIILNVCLIIMPIVIIGCGTTNSVAESQPESIQPAAPAVESPPEDSADESLEQSNEPIKAPENANYTITFNATWSAETHSDFYVTNAHFSPFVAYSHNGSPESHIFEIGSVASQAIEEMAETGETGLLES